MNRSGDDVQRDSDFLPAVQDEEARRQRVVLIREELPTGSVSTRIILLFSSVNPHHRVATPADLLF